MKKDNDRIQIIVIEDELGNNIKRFLVSKKLLLSTFVGWTLFTVVITVYAVFSTANFQKFYSTTTEKIDSLQAQLQTLKEERDKLRKEVALLKQEKKETIKKLAQRVEIIDEIMKKLGINTFKKNGEGGLSLSLEKFIETPSQVNLSDVIPSIDSTIEELSTTPIGYPCAGKITSGFGFRINPLTQRSEFHLGIDIANKWGTPVRTTGDGTVIKAGWCGLLGNCIEIKHGNGFKTLYGHLAKLLVVKGEKVKRGEIIGLMGNSGRSTGPHLHYTIIYEGKYVNPMRFVEAWKNDREKRKQEN